ADNADVSEAGAPSSAKIDRRGRLVAIEVDKHLSAAGVDRIGVAGLHRDRSGTGGHRHRSLKAVDKGVAAAAAAGADGVAGGADDIGVDRQAAGTGHRAAAAGELRVAAAGVPVVDEVGAGTAGDGLALADVEDE